MADKKETIADIIAEMKREAAKIFPALPIAVLQLATRLEAACLEAAWKRERELTKPAENVNSCAASDTAGNCAKLREALEAIINGYKNADLCDMNYGEWCHDPANVCVNVPLCKAIHEARAALAAPPRNCDKFGGDYKMLHTAWFDWTGSPSGQNADGTAKLTFAKWLLAPAKEGGAK